MEKVNIDKIQFLFIYIIFRQLKEKEFHLKSIDTLTNDIKELEEEIKVLLKDERRHIRKMMFPEFYKPRQMYEIKFQEFFEINFLYFVLISDATPIWM